ncbi:MAG: Asp-tRNA(Asn)/Glu-tRNA(Gln) amidotransferase subunit GatC [Planctomycetes bacterium]|nr:Asp-tRNA(Asn)/Glu-tRNA(Gln) amidotransferase subunit GatC [Planctomycetota bacterium]
MSNRIDERQVRHIAHLARLRLSDEEIARLGSQLSDVVLYVEKLNEVATEGVEPTAHPLAVCNVLREDVVKPSLGVDAVFENAPDAAAPYFKVPKVLDQMDA